MNWDRTDKPWTCPACGAAVAGDKPCHRECCKNPSGLCHSDPNPKISTFHEIVRAALEEMDNRPDLDHYRVYSADKLAESILVHMTAFALARAEAEDAAEANLASA